MMETAAHAPQALALGPNAVIRVAHVAEWADRSTSGVHRTVAGLVSHLDHYGVRSEVWHLSPNHATTSETRAGSVRITRLPAFRRPRSAVSGLPTATRAYIRSRRAEIDLLHLHSVFIPDNAWVVRVAERPYVLTPNGGYSPEVIGGRRRIAKAIWMRLHERDYVRRAALVHAVSPRELDQLAATFGASQLLFVPNAVDIPSTGGSPRERTSGPRKRVVFLGRLAVDHKGLDLLVKGFAGLVRRRHEPDVELIVAGPDVRSGRAELEALAAPVLPDGVVRFTGPVFSSEKDALLRTAFVFVHASRWEGMPFAVLEALAAGCPVIVTAETNLGEFIEDFEAGVVVEGSADGVGNGLERLLTLPPGHYEAMCQAARRLAMERFSWPGVAKQVAAAYRTIVG